MTANPQARLSVITEDELIRLDSEGKFFEVANGELVPMSPVGYEHSELTFHVAKLLDSIVRDRKLGYVHPDNLIYVLARNEAEGLEIARIPDVSFIRRGRFPKDFDRKRPFPGAPNLAVEVISPSETETVTLAKVRDYLRYGSEEVWVLFPDAQEVYQYRSSDPKTIHVYTGDDVIDTTALFPGLMLKTSDLFVLPELE
ncbi:MAG: Uma2 family endonuclease [Chloroflexi bacterium]|uniref:Uma2 family endonuclease n=1 Tax=Candidatus Flexifilum breve TaxID=3140694 RepID=UPI0031353D20|nr:Uma2 family endonuclease [Chloroflexota bacterium]